VLDTERAAKDDRDLAKLGALTRLDPTARASHMRDADAVFFRVHATDVLVDDLRLVSGGFDAGRAGDELRHEASPWVLQ